MLPYNTSEVIKCLSSAYNRLNITCALHKNSYDILVSFGSTVNGPSILSAYTNGRQFSPS